MPLADLLYTTDEIARTGAESVAAPTANPAPDAQRIDVEGFDLIPLSKLWCILSRREWDVSLLESFEQVYEGSDDGPWICRLPNDLLDKLSGLTNDAVATVAQVWGETDELSDLELRDHGVTQDILVQIVRLCKLAKNAGKNVFLWMSL